MNNFDLDSKLRNAPVPARGEDYWESFPQRVRRQLQRPAPMERVVQRVWLPRLAWGGGIAFACLILSLSLWHGPKQVRHTTSSAVSKDGKSFRGQFALISSRIRILLQDEHGLHYLVADQE